MTKPRKCKICKAPFVQFSTLHTVCSPRCGLELALRNIAKREASHKRILRAEMKEARERIKTKSEWAREAQTVFNRFIRLRDKSAPCISCQRHHTGQYHAGHYRTDKSIRFEELNCHKQCSSCNLHLSGNILEYRKHLEVKIGADKLQWLEGPHEPPKYTIDDLKAIKLKYAKLCKEMT